MNGEPHCEAPGNDCVRYARNAALGPTLGALARTVTHSAIEIVHEFWRLMGTNDFYAVGGVLADDFILDWPQSNERIRGRERFARMNTEFPANGRWVFTINRIVATGDEAVSDVSVTDGSRQDRALTFFTVRKDKITHIVEYWPEPFIAPANRGHLVEPIE